MKLTSLSVFFPCSNDGKILPYLLLKTYQILPKLAKKYEVIVIDDGSIDDSLAILYELRKKYPHLRIIEHKKNMGYGAVLISGFTKARYEWVFYTDGDGQYDPLEIVKLIKKLKSDIDIVNGYKLNRGDNFLRKVTGSLYNFLIHQLYDLPIRDIDCDFRLIRRELLKKIQLESTSGVICLELILKLKQAGARFREVGVHHYPRLIGKSQFFQLRHLINTFKDHLRLYFHR